MILMPPSLAHQPEAGAVEYVRELQYWAVANPMEVKLVIDLDEEAEDGTVETIGDTVKLQPGDKVHRASVAARSRRLHP